MKDLTPLTPAQQEEFQNRRETAAVVQQRCLSCSAWYETARQSARFTEAFFCDCGVFMSYEVEPVGHTITPGIDYSDPDARLDTGMKVSEAIQRAAAWWDKTGRHLMRKDGGKGSDKAVSLDPASQNFVASGVLNGEPFETLTKRERTQVVKAFHHFTIRKPQQL